MEPREVEQGEGLDLDGAEARFRDYALAVLSSAPDMATDLFLRPYEEYDRLRGLAALGGRKERRIVDDVPYPPLRGPRTPDMYPIDDLGAALLAVRGKKAAFIPKSWYKGARAIILVLGLSEVLKGQYPEDIMDLEVWDVVEHRKGLVLDRMKSAGLRADEELALEASTRSTKVWPVLALLLARDLTELYGVLNSSVYVDHIEAGRLSVENLVLSNKEFEKIRTLAELHPYAGLSMTNPTVKVEIGLRGSLVRVAIDVPPIATPTFDARNLSALPRLALPRLVNLGTLSAKMAAQLVQLIRDETPMLIAGKTGVGKTTLANALLAYSDPSWRIISVEEVREIEDFSKYGLRHHAYAMPGERREAVTLFLHRNPDLVFMGEILTHEHARAFGLAKDSGFRILGTTHARDHLALQSKWTDWGVESALKGVHVIIMEYRRVAGLFTRKASDWVRMEPSPRPDCEKRLRMTLGSLHNEQVVGCFRGGTH